MLKLLYTKLVNEIKRLITVSNVAAEAPFGGLLRILALGNPAACGFCRLSATGARRSRESPRPIFPVRFLFQFLRFWGYVCDLPHESGAQAGWELRNPCKFTCWQGIWGRDGFAHDWLLRHAFREGEKLAPFLGKLQKLPPLRREPGLKRRIFRQLPAGPSASCPYSECVDAHYGP